MALKLMYITNRADIAAVAEAAGVDRIFVDMEYIGKKDRQGGMDTVQCHHTIEDVKKIRQVVRSSQLLVRCNPIHTQTQEHSGSREEIEEIILAGADIIMLPYFKSKDDVQEFLSIVGGRSKVCLLLETPEAVNAADEILRLPGVDEVMIGLNDLSLGYHRKFMFELLADGTVEMLCRKCAEHHISYGFGGIASLGKGLLPSEYVIKEHYRLGSGCAILSRSFCDVRYIEDIKQISSIFRNGVQAIRNYEKCCQKQSDTYEQNRRKVVQIVNNIIGK